jgi:hypothetical protein
MWHKVRNYVFSILGLIIVVSLVVFVCKTRPVVQWSRNFDGGSGHSIQQTMDGGYIMCGDKSKGIWLIRTDADGNKLWDKMFDAEFDDDGLSVQQTTDGGYIVCGNRRSGGHYNSEDIWLIKTDADGNKLWDKAFGGEDGDPAGSVQQTRDGGYILCGSTSSYGAGSYDIWLIKTDADGNKLWEKIFGDKLCDWGHSVKQTVDGGYIICGSTEERYTGGAITDADIWLIKTDVDGNKLWDNKFDGLLDDCGYSVQQTTDGGYIVCGITGYWSRNDGDVWLVKTDANGNKLWDKKFGGWGSNQGYSVQQTADGGYILCGTTFFYLDWISIGRQPILIRTDANGNKRWSKTLGGIFGKYGCKSVQQTTDGGYIVSGSGAMLWKIAPVRSKCPFF